MSATYEPPDEVEIVVLVRGSMRKLHSEAMTPQLAREQIAVIRRAQKESPNEHIELDWLCVLAGEVLSVHIGR